MVFLKRTVLLEEHDILNLISRQERESIKLDYKRDITTSDSGKGELAKDVSALANSQGGYIIFGVDEDSNGAPISPPIGVPIALGRQKTEEWLEQVILSNVTPRPTVILKAIPMSNDPDMVLVVVEVPLGTHAPYMVTFSGDRRYYRRYFKRNNFQSLPAEDHEVKELYRRSLRMVDQVWEYLSRRSYGDPDTIDFGKNRFSQKLSAAECNNAGRKMSDSFYSFLTIPSIIEGNLIDTQNPDLWQWLDPNDRRYAPRTGDLFVPGRPRSISDGILLPEYDPSQAFCQFLRISRNGYIEYSSTKGICLNNDMTGMISLSIIATKFEMFLGFIEELYLQTTYSGEVNILLNLIAVENLQAHEWSRVEGPDSPIYPDKALQEIFKVELTQITDQKNGLVNEAKRRLSSSWGFRDIPNTLTSEY